MSSLRIAFGCEARVGKDMSCDYIVERLTNKGLRPIRMAFADPLYDIMYYAQRQCGFPEIKDRKFLQWVGTEWARAQNSNVWVDCLASKIKTISDDTPIIVTDLRFPNEAKCLRDLGFTLVRLTRDVDRMEERVPRHISEIALLDYDWDYVVENNGSLEVLYQKLDALMRQIPWR